MRVIQFGTQTCINAFADSEVGGPPVWDGINAPSRELVAEMNALGVLMDITHASAQAQNQIIEASTALVVASRGGLAAVARAGLSDDTLRALARRAASLASSVRPRRCSRYLEWMAPTQRPPQPPRS